MHTVFQSGNFNETVNTRHLAYEKLGG